MSAVTDRLTVAGFGTGWSAVRRMPEGAAYALFERLADASWLRHGSGVRRLEQNLNRVTGGELSEGELRALSREGMRSYLRYYCDAFRMPGWSDERVRNGFVLENKEFLHDALDSGRGAVVSLPHSGNWDAAGAWAALEFGSVTTVAERLKPEELYEKFLDFRRARGIEVLPHEGGDVPVLATLSQRVRDGKLVAVLGDRDLSSRGVPVEFFGGTTKLPIGPAAPGRSWLNSAKGGDPMSHGSAQRSVIRSARHYR